MLDGNVFYHETIRKITTAFGTVFNNISIRRIDSEDSVLKTIKVPFAYGSREKWLTRLEQQSSISTGPKVQLTLPRIGFVMSNIQYDSTRQLNPIQKYRKLSDTGTTMSFQYERVPYTFSYSLSVYVKNTEDGLQIIEQILPFFSPQYNLTLIDNPDLSQQTDIPIILKSINNEDIYEGDMQTRRVMIWNLEFDIKAYLYRPTRTQGRIKTVIIDYYVGGCDEPNDARRVERYTVRPDPITAEQTDDFGFSETTTFFEEFSVRDADGNAEIDRSSSSSSSTEDELTSSSSNSSSSSSLDSLTSSSSSSSSPSSRSSMSSSSSSSSTALSSTSSASSSSSSSSTEDEMSSSSSSSSSSSTAVSNTSSSSSTAVSESSSSELSETSSSSSSSSSSSADLNQ